MNPHETLSVWHLIANASLVVQLVMLTLLGASVVSWSFIFQRASVVNRARRALESFEARFWSGTDLPTLYRDTSQQPQVDSGAESIFRAGFKEFQRLREKGMEAEAVMQGTSRAMRVALAQEQARLEAQLPFLATVGSTSPYIGLFGTVWGIMTSFLGLANVKQATLAVVAPGIAEALIATAIGLFAAIPAVIAYNRYSTAADALLSRYETFAEEFAGILHREAHSR